MAETFDDIQHQAKRLIDHYSERDKILEDLRMMFHMEWRDAPRQDWIRPTMSPEAFNACIGAIRLLTATEPQINIPFEEADDQAKTYSEDLERAARAMLAGSERITQRPPHYEVVFSATLFGEVCLGVSKTADLLEMARRTKIRGTIKRMEMINKRTPYLFQVWNPENCYPDFDGLGLRGMLRRVEVTWGEVLDTWGDAAEQAGGQRERQDKVKLNDWYDWGQRCVWIDQGGAPIYLKDNDLEFLPIVAQVAEGSFMFEKPEQQRIPLLYALLKSGLWQRQNLSLTVLFSLVYVLGSVPLWKRKTLEPGKSLEMRREGPIGVVDLDPSDDIQPFAEKIIDPAVIEALQIAQSLTEQSTLNKVALGQPLKGATFSTVSLLASSGRLPLISPKQISGKAVASALEIALAWIKADGETEKVYTRTGAAVALDPKKIPENLMLEVNLEPDLPQDKLQQANTGQMIVGSRLASKRWVRENILNTGQSRAMDKEIWMEQRLQAELEGAMALVQAKYQQQLRQMQAQGAGQAPGAQPNPQPSPQAGTAPAPMASPTGEGGAGISPEMLARLQEEQAIEMGASMGPEGALPPGGQVGPGAPLQGPVRPRNNA